MNTGAAADYRRSIRKVCHYISENLHENLTVEKLSRVANFSKHHFHRQFYGYMGVNVSRFILLMRLKRASYQLVFNHDLRVIDIALDAGYENPESFSRAFKNTFGQTPTQFRMNPDWKSWEEKYCFTLLSGDHKMDVEIVQFEQTAIACLEHRGSPDRVNESVSQFIEWRKRSGLSPLESCQTYGLVYDDPKTTEPDEFRFDICGSLKSDHLPANEQNVQLKQIPGGRCARVRHIGSYETMGEKVHYLYGVWLPESGENLRGFPCFFHYLNLFPEVPENELITDIYLPLA